ncbi:hypothetical protein CHS0354_029491 [Potamilus streckersoni]|uniref:Uncharacterized protein n=1 Tax=Potamilus streckersoni TaxID=2493646 RepID=A0AAE0S7A2_9BIVA|nr:hypothetical protein CHS0354_029491 [Potamilus streckersoni]
MKKIPTVVTDICARMVDFASHQRQAIVAFALNILAASFARIIWIFVPVIPAFSMERAKTYMIHTSVTA